jgi:dolichol-phosphate mannosyltransferase
MAPTAPQRLRAGSFPVSVVVPVLDEADNLAALAREIQTALAGVADYEILFVDDGSSDATPARLAALVAGNPRIRALRHASRFGQSMALRTGILAARRPWIATLDGDRQNDPADLPAILERVKGGDHVWTLFVGHRTRRKDSFAKRFASRFANGLRSRLLKDGTPDTGCGLKVFARELYLRLPYFDHQHRFLPALVKREGGRVVSLPVRHRARTAGCSKYGNLQRAVVGLVDLLGVAWLMRRSPRDYIAAEVKRGSNELAA